MIKSWGAGKYYCDVCDVRDNEYGIPMVSWTAGWPPPKFCWDCFAKQWSNPSKVIHAVYAIVEALKKSGFKASSAADMRSKLMMCGVSVEGVSPGRLSAMIYREW